MEQINLNKFPFLKVIMAVVIIALLSWNIVQWRNGRSNESSIAALTAENTKYKLKSGEVVTSQPVAQLTEKQIKNIIATDPVLVELSKQFSKISSIKTVTVRTEIPKTAMAFDKPISVTEIDSTTKELKFERTGSKFDKWYEFGYRVTQDSISIEPFATWTDVKIVDGFKRKWFLGRQTYTADILFTNPHMEASQVKAYQVTVPKKWHETRAVNIAFGILLKTLEESLTRK